MKIAKWTLTINMDQDIPAGQFPTFDPGPIHNFLSVMPDWMNINQKDLNLRLALESLPIPLKGPIPPESVHRYSFKRPFR
jgi:hypothetical protein